MLRHWSQFARICQPTSEDIKLYIIVIIIIIIIIIIIVIIIHHNKERI